VWVMKASSNCFCANRTCPRKLSALGQCQKVVIWQESCYNSLSISSGFRTVRGFVESDGFLYHDLGVGDISKLQKITPIVEVHHCEPSRCLWVIFFAMLLAFLQILEAFVEVSELAPGYTDIEEILTDEMVRFAVDLPTSNQVLFPDRLGSLLVALVVYDYCPNATRRCTELRVFFAQNFGRFENLQCPCEGAFLEQIPAQLLSVPDLMILTPLSNKHTRHSSTAAL
jgi:hypothetical protein